MRRQDTGVQSSISLFVKPQQAAGSDTAAPQQKKPFRSTLLQILGHSNTNSKAQQQQLDVKLPSGLLQSAVTAAAPARAPGKTGPRSTARAVSDPCRSNKAAQHTSAPVLHSAQAPEGAGGAHEPSSSGSWSAGSSSSSLQPCPLCGQQVPRAQLQQHVDQELAELDLQEHTPANTARDRWGPGSTAQPQQQRRHQQQQQAGCTGWQGTAEQPNSKRHKPLPQLQQQQHWQPANQQNYKQQQSWHHQKQPQQPQCQQQQQQQDVHWQQNHQQQRGHAPRHEHSVPPLQHHRHEGLHKQQCPHWQQRSSGRVQVKSLSAAPRRPVGPDGQPVTHVDGGFDHWGDSSLNYLDDSAIGIDGGLPSADAYWEGVGRCAVGPRTLR